MLGLITMLMNVRSLIPICIAINVLVFFLWRFFPKGLMVNHFTVSWVGLLQHRYWTMLSSAFSHIELWHLMINMFVLHSFGTVLEVVLGKSSFWKFYIIAALCGSFAHAGLSRFLMQEPNIPAVGASGAIAGLILVFALKFPKEKILFFGILPVPALFGSLIFIGLDLWGLFMQSKGGGLSIGHGAHLGGSLAGILYYWFMLHKA